MWKRTLATAIALFALCGAAAAAAPPLAVSPGHPTSAPLVESRCPTFDWGEVPGAEAYELEVRRLDPGFESAEPVLRQTLPGSVDGWTPSLERCLARGGQFAWRVRATLRRGVTDWSAPNRFQIAPLPSMGEFREALATVMALVERMERIEGIEALLERMERLEGLERIEEPAAPAVAESTAPPPPELLADDLRMEEEDESDLDALAALQPIVAGDIVIASDRVTSGVNIRERPTSGSATIGTLAPGDRLPYIGSVPRWHEVLLPDGRHGFVSKSWTHVVAAGPAGDFTVEVADVGTGLAVLVRGPDFSLVYDAGSNDDLRRGDANRFLAFLRAVQPQLATIDHLIVSHPHRDHVELLADLVENYQVRHVWDSGAINPICGYRAFLRAVASRSDTVYHSARSGFGTHTIDFDAKRCYGQNLAAESLALRHGSRIDSDPIPIGEGASMTFLYADGSRHSSFNENSLVVRLDLGGTRVLIMGDAEAGGRADPSSAPSEHSIEGMLLDCCRDALRSDVLIVGHHGSKTSSRVAFLDAIGASTAIVSAGPTRYGSVVLPDDEVVRELEGRGALFRTDLNDRTCGDHSNKVGSDADGRAGGCDNVRVHIPATGAVSVAYLQVAD